MRSIVSIVMGDGWGADLMEHALHMGPRRVFDDRSIFMEPLDASPNIGQQAPLLGAAGADVDALFCDLATNEPQDGRGRIVEARLSRT
jgi:hypothetical protein